MAGRDQVLERLAESRNRALDGGPSGRLALVSGESGIGKTFLLAEFAQRSRARMRVVSGECLPLSANTTVVGEIASGPLHPLRGFLQIVADLCHQGGPPVTATLLGPRAAVLAPYEPALARFATEAELADARATPTDAARERLLECLRETLAALAADRPLLLLLDDLQWADDLTLAFLSSMTPAFLARPLMVV